MKNIIGYCLTLSVLIFSSCTKTAVKKNALGVYSCCIDYGCASPKKTTKCEDALAEIITDPSFGEAIHLQGNFPDGSDIQLVLLWKGSSGTFTFGEYEDNTAAYYPVLGQLEGYSTIDAGTSGTLNITEYDQTNQRLTGTFSFKGKHFNGSGFDNTFLNVSGSFTDIPIWDPLDPSTFPCK